MTARVLVVDDIPTNVRLLEARLTAEYFEVVTASSGAEAIELCLSSNIDIVLLDVMMPGMDGFETCRRLKADPRTYHVPVVIITALDQSADRVKGLEAGADDFLNKPVDDVQLLARVKSLTRLKALTDELRARAATGQRIAVEDSERILESTRAEGGQILLIDHDERRAQRVKSILGSAGYETHVFTDPATQISSIDHENFDLALISLDLGETDPLRVCSQLKTNELTRMLPVIAIADEGDRDRILRGLDLGINDYIMRPLERHELVARVKTQVRRHRYAAALRETVTTTLRLAVIDELTGLYNRRYFDRHLALLLDKSLSQDRSMALIMLDIDFFKTVNDNHGHDAGDMVLKEFAIRLQRNIRGVDLACRLGGEEFVVLMPDSDLKQARHVAERIRQAVSEPGMKLPGGSSISITVSAGIALNERSKDGSEAIIKRADVALYRAKQEGRNRVATDAA